MASHNNSVTYEKNLIDKIEVSLNLSPSSFSIIKITDIEKKCHHTDLKKTLKTKTFDNQNLNFFIWRNVSMCCCFFLLFFSSTF